MQRNQLIGLMHPPQANHRTEQNGHGDQHIQIQHQTKASHRQHRLDRQVLCGGLAQQTRRIKHGHHHNQEQQHPPSRLEERASQIPLDQHDPPA